MTEDDEYSQKQELSVAVSNEHLLLLSFFLFLDRRSARVKSQSTHPHLSSIIQQKKVKGKRQHSENE